MSALARLKTDLEQAFSAVSGRIFVLVETALREHEEERLRALTKTDGKKLTQRQKRKANPQQRQGREEAHSKTQTEEYSDPDLPLTCRPRELLHLRPKVSLYTTEADTETRDKAAQTPEPPQVKEESDVILKHNGTEENGSPSDLTCSFCLKVFGHRLNLQRHLQVHLGGFRCSVCSKDFSRRDTLNRHLRTYHPDHIDQVMDKDQDKDQREKPEREEEAPAEGAAHNSQCPPRGKVRNRPPGGAARNRSRKNYKSQPLHRVCRLCFRGFRYDSELLEHMRVHSGERPFSCTICKKSFMTRSTLNKHVVIHKGEKPFSCSVCGKCFSRKAILEKHGKIHQEKKPEPKPGPNKEPDQIPEDQVIYCSI